MSDPFQAITQYAEQRVRDVAPRARRAPATSAQRAMVLMEQLAGGRTGYSVRHAYQLRGRLDVPALTSALRHVLSLHATLRTRFQMQSDTLWQLVEPEPKLDLARFDLTGSTVRRSLSEVIDDRLTEPLDLELGPVMRAELYTVEEQVHALVLCAHHATNDATSVAIVGQDLSAAYEHYIGAGTALPLPPRQFDGFAEAEAAADQEAAAAYWAGLLADAPVTGLPFDLQPGADPTFEALWVRRGIEHDLDGLAALARATGTSVFLVLLTAIGMAVARQSGNADRAVVATTVSTRPEEYERTVGPFVNTIPVLIPAGTDFEVALKETASQLRRSLDHAAVPFDDVSPAAAQAEGMPVLPVTFTDNTAYGEDLRLPGLECRTVQLTARYCQRPLALYLMRGESGLELSACASVSHYTPASVAQLVDRALAVVRSWVEASAPAQAAEPARAEAVGGTEVSRHLATVRAAWAEVLGCREDELDEDFFTSGGGSLTAMRLATRIQISLRQIFKLRTQSAMAAVLAEREAITGHREEVRS